MVPIHVDAGADDRVEHFLVLGAHDDEQQVVLVDDGVALGDDHLAIAGALHARDDEVVVDDGVQAPQVAAEDELVGHAVGEDVRSQLRLCGLVLDVLGLALGVDLEDDLDHNHRQDDAHHAQGIGSGIAHRHGLVERGGVGALGLDERLLGGTQAGRVGHGSREDAHQVGDAHGAHTIIYSHGHGDVERDDEHSQAVEHQAALLERREEAGAHLQSDREDEQDEAKLLNEFDDVGVDGEAQVSGQDAHEQDKGCAERDAKDFLFAQDHTQGDDERVDEDGVSHTAARNEVSQPSHFFIKTIITEKRVQRYNKNKTCAWCAVKFLLHQPKKCRMKPMAVNGLKG